MSAALRLRELYAFRELVGNLVARDLRLKYRRSALGAAWSVLNPLFFVAIYTAVFSVVLRAFILPQYWTFVLAGLLPWLFFANSLGACSTSFTQNASLISKVAFPVESLAIATVLSNFVNFLITVALLLLAVVAAGRPVGPSLILLPVLLAAQLVLALGLGLGIASLTVYFRDLEHLVGLFLTALFYLTPVLYPLTFAGRYARWLKLNPVAWYVDSYHAILYSGRWPDPVLFLPAIGLALASLAGGYAIFLRLRPRLPEEV